MLPSIWELQLKRVGFDEVSPWLWRSWNAEQPRHQHCLPPEEIVFHLENFPCFSLEKSMTMNWWGRGKGCFWLKKSLNPQLWKNYILKLLSMALENPPSLIWKMLHPCIWKTLLPEEYTSVQAPEDIGSDPRNHSIVGSGKHSSLRWRKHTLHDSAPGSGKYNIRKPFITRSGTHTVLCCGEFFAPKYGGLSPLSLQVSEPSNVLANV